MMTNMELSPFARHFSEMSEILRDMERVSHFAMTPELHRTFVTFVCEKFDSDGTPGDWKKELNSLEEVRREFEEAYTKLWREKFHDDPATRRPAEAVPGGEAAGYAMIVLSRAMDCMAAGGVVNLDALKKALRAQLERRFGGPLPSELAERLANVQDFEGLRSLTISINRNEAMANFASLMEKERAEAAS